VTNQSPPEQAAPLKCAQCDRTMTTPLVCDYCHALNAGAALADHYTLLGLPRKFDVDAEQLQRRYIALSRHAHPDFHDGESDDVQELHLRVSAAVNDAYRTLRDPVSRASYLLGLLGGRSSADDRSVPPGFLETTMMMQEEVAEAAASGDEKAKRRLGEVLRTQHDGLLRRLEELFAEHQEGLGCEAVRSGLLHEIRSQLNAISYVRKLQSQL
jgi:molecular chaperone HscB